MMEEKNLSYLNTASWQEPPKALLQRLPPIRQTELITSMIVGG